MFREADRKMAGIQYSLEDRASLERKYKKQVNNCDNEASHNDVWNSRNYDGDHNCHRERRQKLLFSAKPAMSFGSLYIYNTDKGIVQQTT